MRNDPLPCLKSFSVLCRTEVIWQNEGLFTQRANAASMQWLEQYHVDLKVCIIGGTMQRRCNIKIRLDKYTVACYCCCQPFTPSVVANEASKSILLLLYVHLYNDFAAFWGTSNWSHVAGHAGKGSKLDCTTQRRVA